MPTYRVEVDANGSLVLPKELRDRLAIASGTQVEFFLAGDGQIHFHAITGSAKGFAGLVTERRSPPISIREMDDAIEDAVSEKTQLSLSAGALGRRNQAAE